MGTPSCWSRCGAEAAQSLQTGRKLRRYQPGRSSIVSSKAIPTERRRCARCSRRHDRRRSPQGARPRPRAPPPLKRLRNLRRATDLARWANVYAVALNSAGRGHPAFKALALVRRPTTPMSYWRASSLSARRGTTPLLSNMLSSFYAESLTTRILSASSSGSGVSPSRRFSWHWLGEANSRRPLVDSGARNGRS
jgi:hypothetical protein